MRDTVICFFHKMCLLTFAASKFSTNLPEACAKGSVLVFVIDLVETSIEHVLLVWVDLRGLKL